LLADEDLGETEIRNERADGDEEDRCHGSSEIEVQYGRELKVRLLTLVRTSSNLIGISNGRSLLIACISTDHQFSIDAL